VFVAKAFKWPAAACGLAFQICTMTLTTRHIHKPFAHALGNQRTEIRRNYTSIKKDCHSYLNDIEATIIASVNDK